ncbi:competence protein CoiA [Fructobacillus durionis]|uniref:Competence protein CoiA n=1 Tax=Fructobacillus durionis TaxID=283737 RepID=A0A1I1FL09_9LACO|nr:competence protein CoiA family protein [Fructobacillus durionis]SFC00087.1 competence protein CoiA [Fructobacillus durionis]
MLIAVTISNQYCLAENAKKNEIYLCPGCRGPVRLKQGESNVAHFAHVSKVACADFSEGESADHLAGKLAIYHYFKGRVPVQVEPVLSQIEQRPDLLVGRPGSQVAIEYQCSPISQADLTRRNEGYAKAGIRVWWILGPNYYQKHLSMATICRFWLAGRLWFYLPGEKSSFVRDSDYSKADFKKRSQIRNFLSDPLHIRSGALPNWSAVFNSNELSQSVKRPVLDIKRQRSKLSLQLAREQINPQIVSYLYERGYRVDQVPAICLLGQSFGLKIPNWQYRLIVLLLFDKAGEKGRTKQDLLRRMARYFYQNYSYQTEVLNDYLEELHQGGFLIIQSEKIFIKTPPPYKE